AARSSFKSSASKSQRTRTPNREPRTSIALPSKVRVGPVDPVLTDRTEDVEHERVLDHFHLVRDVRWNLHDLARADNDVAAVDREAQYAVDDDADLLVFVRMQRHHSAALQREAGDGHPLGSDVLPGDCRGDVLGREIRPAMMRDG